MAAPIIKPTLAEAFPERPDLVEGSAELKKRVYFRIFYYILGRLDTIHDFSSERTTETNDTCLSLGIKPKDRMLFILKGILRRSDPLLKMADIYAELNTRPGKTFEHKMFSSFTDLLTVDRILNEVDDELFTNLGPGYTKPEFIKTIKDYLYNEVYQLTPGTVLQQDIIQDGETYFQSSKGRLSSAIFEINIPAIVYTEDWQNRLIDFIKDAYSQCLVEPGNLATPLKIVEDASAFPKSLFTNAVQNLRQFVKLNAPQTHWDPAGFHNFPDKIRTSHLNLVVGTKWGAPSFGCSQGLDKAATIKAQFNSQTNYFQLEEANKNILQLDIMPYVSPRKLNITAGPSVNHLFMHMVLNANSDKLREVVGAGRIDDVIRNAKRMINFANSPLKSPQGLKNITLPLKEILDREDKAAYLRQLETSKMSGDHEDKNAALFNSAVLWCSDEPLFCACVLDKVPAVYVRRPGPSIILRFYVPPPASPEESQRIKLENDVKKCIHMALEYNKIFRNSDYVYIPFIESIKTVMSNPITINGKTFLGNILKYVILNNFLNKDLEKIERLNEANNLLRGSGKLAGLLNKYTELAYKADDITNESLTALAKGLQEKLQSKADGAGPEITSDDIRLLDRQIHDQLVDIPRILNKTTTGISKLDYSLFTESKGASVLPLFISGDKGWNMNTNGLFTYYNSFIPAIKEISSIYVFIMNVLYKNGGAINFDNIERHNKVIIIKHLTRMTALLQSLGLTVVQRQVIVDRIKNNDAAKEGELNTTVNGLYERFMEQYAALVPPASAGGGGGGGAQGGGTYTLKHRRIKRRSHSHSKHYTQKKRASKHSPIKRASSKNKSLIEEVNDPSGLSEIPGKNNQSDDPKMLADNNEVKEGVEKKESNIYSEAYNLIIKEVSHPPFNLTAKQYANQIVYRMMIMDSINEILEEPGKGSQEGGGDKGKGGGGGCGGGGGGAAADALVDAENSRFWYDFSNDYIIPFMAKFIHKDYDVPTLITCGIIDGTFLPALMSLLERVSIIDTSYIQGDGKLMVDQAVSVLESLNLKISNAYDNKDTKYIYVREKFGADGSTTVDDLKRIWEALGEFPHEQGDKIVVPDRFFRNMGDFFQFLNAIFINETIPVKDRGIQLINLDDPAAYSDSLLSPDEATSIKFIRDNLKLVQYSTKLFIITFLDLYNATDTYEDSADVDIVYNQAADTDIEVAGGGGGGGGGAKGGSRGHTFKLEKRHKKSGKRRCGSPRRLSLRKDM